MNFYIFQGFRFHAVAFISLSLDTFKHITVFNPNRSCDKHLLTIRVFYVKVELNLQAYMY